MGRIVQEISIDEHGAEILGALHLGEGGGAKHSPPGDTGEHTQGHL